VSCCGSNLAGKIRQIWFMLKERSYFFAKKQLNPLFNMTEMPLSTRFNNMQGGFELLYLPPDFSRNSLFSSNDWLA
jgi:hypothetical protein